MKYIGKLLGWILLGVNGIVVLFLLLAAYSPYLHPQDYPILSCFGLTFPIFLCFNIVFFFFWLLVYRKYALLPILAFVGGWDAICTYIPVNLFQDEKPEETLKFLSYNTMAFGNRQAHTKEKPNKILKYLAESDADIICLQECVWGDRLKKKDVDYALRKYKYKHHYSFANGLNGLGVYSRYPILSAKPIPIESRSNASIAYRIKVDKDTLLVINNHLESFRILDADVEVYHEMMDTPNNGHFFSSFRRLWKKLALPAAVRARQADKVTETFSDYQGQGVIVCGDFNDSPISYSHQVMTRHLKDAFVESGNGLGISYHQNRFYFRIDHILTTPNIQSYECTVDRSVTASDHYPIWCNLLIKSK